MDSGYHIYCLKIGDTAFTRSVKSLVRSYRVLLLSTKVFSQARGLRRIGLPVHSKNEMVRAVSFVA